jgi:hypothetical protein
MLYKVRLTKESPSFQLVATTYFRMLYPKQIESNQPLHGEGLAGLKMVLMNDRYCFNQFSWYNHSDNAFPIYDWLKPPRSVEPMREALFNRVIVSVEGMEWKEGMEILCEVEYEVTATDQ